MKDATGEGLQISQCNTCAHKLTGDACAAFDKIPIQILTNALKHDRTLENQKKDFIYERKQK